MFSAGKDIEFYRTADNFYIFFLSLCEKIE